MNHLSAEALIKVPFHDVDMARIAWHGHYAKYFEIARCELLDKIQYNYQEMLESGYLWPVVDMHIRYVKPIVFGQTIRVVATITEWENRLKINYIAYDADSNQRLTKGHTIQVAVDAASGELQLACPRVLTDKCEA